MKIKYLVSCISSSAVLLAFSSQASAFYTKWECWDTYSYNYNDGCVAEVIESPNRDHVSYALVGQCNINNEKSKFSIPCEKVLVTEKNLENYETYKCFGEDPTASINFYWTYHNDYSFDIKFKGLLTKKDIHMWCVFDH